MNGASIVFQYAMLSAIAEKSIYEKTDWSISANGDMNPFRYLDRQVPRAIGKVCYDSPRSVEEISQATGIPCVYIEDELPNLLGGEPLVRQGGKYRTNFIVKTRAFQKRAVERCPKKRRS